MLCSAFCLSGAAGNSLQDELEEFAQASALQGKGGDVKINRPKRRLDMPLVSL
jgi:hypothetical protein